MSGGRASGAALGLGAETPFRDAASVVLRRRLGAVADAVERLGIASESPEVRPSDIHQVRVSVRRATAALSVFEGCIESARRLAKVRKRLKGLRRAIGTARACDVGLSMLAHDRGASEHERRIDIDLLEGVLGRRREKSMMKIRRAVARCSADRLRRWGKRLASAAAESGEPTDPAGVRSLEQAAREALAGLLAEVRACGGADLGQAESLHELRLSAKRLRYTTEVFGPCFQPERLDEATNLLVRVQDRLGAANDLSEMVALILERIDRERAGDAYATLLSEYSGRYEEARTEFVSWWRLSGERDLVASYRGLVADARADEAPPGPPASSRPRIVPITPGVNRSEA